MENHVFAIARFKEMKRECEFQALLHRFHLAGGPSRARIADIPYINLESDDEEVHNVSNGQFENFWPRQSGIGGSVCMKLDKKLPGPSFYGGNPPSSAPMSQPKPGEKLIRNFFKTPPSVIGQAPPEKQRKTLSLDMHQRFFNAINILGGPLAATPKKIKELLHDEDITDEWINNHLVPYKDIHLHNRCLIAGQDVVKVNRNTIQIGSRRIPFIGESSNGHMASEANKAGGSTLVGSVRDHVPLYPSHGNASSWRHASSWRRAL